MLPIKLLLYVLPAVVFAATNQTQTPQRQFKSVTIEVPTLLNGRSLEAQTERIVYYVDQGYAIAHGDVNIGLEKDLLALQVPEAGLKTRDSISQRRESKLDTRSLSIFPNSTAQKWPGAVFKYKFNDAEAESYLFWRVGQAIERWKEVSPFLIFQQLPTSSETVLGVVTIVMTENQPACWAPIGYNDKWAMTISLDLSCGIASTVHEFGHALGLQHEHQRPDRDESVFFNCSALMDYDTYGGVNTPCPGEPEKCCEDTTCWGWACSFRHLHEFYTNDAYDITSVMHYRATGFATWDGKTLVGLNGRTVPEIEPESPSNGDKTRICEIYSDECQNPTIPVCGNGIVERGEGCDDGNTVDGDGCSSTCAVEGCDTCSPLPQDNKCDITTSCITTESGTQNFCACRAGYKADPGFNETTDGFGVQWRLPFIGQEYRVFVKPGVTCNTLCSQWGPGTDGCSEVPIRSECSK